MSIYPNDYCHECQQTPAVEQPAPPVCEGEKCVEIYDSACVEYTGAAIPCKQIESGERMTSVINKLATCYDEEFVRGLLRMIRDDSTLKALFSQIVCSVDCETVTVCDIPSGIVLGTANTTGFTVSWAKITGVSGYLLQVKKTSDVSWTQVGGLLPNSSFTTATASVHVTGLESASVYEVRIKTICTDGSESSWSDPVSITTTTPVAPPVCVVPSTPTLTFN